MCPADSRFISRTTVKHVLGLYQDQLIGYYVVHFWAISEIILCNYTEANSQRNTQKNV